MPVMTPVEAAAAVPVAQPPEVLTMSPEEAALAVPSATPVAGSGNILNDWSAEEIADYARKNPSFSLSNAVHSDPTALQNPAMQQKAAEAFNLLKRDWFEGTPVISGIKHGDLGETVEGVKQLGRTAGSMLAGTAKWGYNAAKVFVDANTDRVVATTDALGLTDVGLKAREEAALATQKRAIETIAGTETAAAGLMHQVGQVAGSLARGMRLKKQLKDYTPEEKLEDFQSALFAEQLRKESLSGHGPLLNLVGSETVKELEAKGMPIDPNVTSELAGGDPLTFMLFGKAMAPVNVAGKFAGKLTGAAKLAPKIEELAQKAGGNLVTAAGKTAEVGTLAAEKTAPVVGAIAGGTVAAKIPLLGEVPIASQIVGAGAGWRAGKAIATDLHKIGESLSKVTTAGRNIVANKITGAYEQLGKDVFRGLPGAVGDVVKGAAIDTGLGATMDTPAERQGMGLGMAFGALHGAGKMGKRVISGQLIDPRWRAGNENPRPANVGANAIFDAMHRAGFSGLLPGQKVRVNATQTLLEGVNKKADVFVAADSNAAERALRQVFNIREEPGVPPVVGEVAPTGPQLLSAETAKLWSQQREMVFEHNGRKVVILIDKPADGSRSGIDAAPHAARHAIENVLGEGNLRKLDAEIIKKYPIDALGTKYAEDTIGRKLREGEDWRSIILDSTNTGNIEAVEKRIAEVTAAYEADATSGGKMPSAAEIKADVERLVKGEGLSWRDKLTPEEATDAARRYMAREVAAENFDAWFKHTGESLKPGTQIPEVLARWIGNIQSVFGQNPIAGKVSEGMSYPLVYDIAKTTGEQARGLLPVIEPSKQGPAIPRGGPANRPPEERAKNSREVAAQAPDGIMPGAEMSQREALGAVAESIATGGAVKLNYLSAPGEMPGLSGESPSANLFSNRKTRRALQEFYNAIDDPATRALWEKTFFADEVTVTNDGKFLVRGFSPEVLAANAHKIAAAALANPALEKLLPAAYTIDRNTGSFTRDAWLEIYNDLSRYVKNQLAGHTGSGEKLVVPQEATKLGFFKPAERPNEVLRLDQDRADFLNILFNYQRPKTGKLGHGKAPLNYMGQLVSEATLPGRVAKPTGGEPTFVDPQQKFGVDKLPVLEVNPLRAKMEAAVGGREKMPSLIEVVQVLRADRIKGVQHAPEVPQLRANTLTVSAGFMPGEGKKPITIEGPDGKKYRAMFDGYQDFSAIGKGKLAQITALEDIPGVTTARSTTYSESLEKGGYKVPPLDKAQFSPADMKKDVEQVREAAYRMPDGKLLTGPTHSHAYMKGEKAYPDAAWATAEDGFVTTKDRFVSRDEALDLAVESGQMKREHYEDTTTNKTLESVDFYKTQQREEANFWGDKEPAPGEPMAQFVPPEKIPEKTVKVYKLFDTRKSQPGKIFPLFIGAKVPTPMGEWIAAENIPTKGFSNRPGWHVGLAPRAKHLLTKEGKLAEGRVWAEAEIPADVDWQTRADASKTKDIRDQVPVGGHYSFRRPARQGGEWKIAGAIKVNRILDAAEVDAINSGAAEVDAINSGAGVEPKAQFMHSLEGIKKMNDREVERQKRGAESETTRLSSYTGDAESGIVIHSAKNRSTAFMRGGEEAKKFLEAVKSAEGDAAKNALIEEQYAQASFMPKDTSRKAKPDYKLREGPGKFAKAWIAPDGTPIQLGGQWHHEWINENPGEAKKYGLKATTSGEENRVDALKKGFARVNYDKNSGTLTVEARKKDWPVLGESIRKLVKENLGKIDNMDVKLLDDKASRVVESEGVQLFTYDAGEKMDNLPLLSAPSSTTEMSAQATPGALTSERVRFMPGGPPEAIKSAAVRDRETGKVYEGYAHFAARQEALGAGVAPHKVIQYEDGFTTNDGKFLNREEAFKRAVELKQYKPEPAPTASNIPDMTGMLESVRFEHQQKMKEMGYEPDVQFTPGYKSKEFDAELEKVRTGANFGQTFNKDGTVWKVDPRKPTDIVTLASVNLPKEELTRENVMKALGDYGRILDEKGTALGVFEMPDGKRVSVDVNALPSQKYRANSVDFAKRNNQVSIWDPLKGEEVKTGGNGETVLSDYRDAHDALKPLLKGTPPIIPDAATEAQAAEYFAQGKPLPPAITKQLTRAQKTRVYPESVEPKKATDLIRSDIKNSPLAKQAGSEEAAIKAFSDKLVEMAEQYKDSPEYQEGLKWYSDFVPKLNAEFGEHAQMFAELLAATSPRNKPMENFKLSMEAVEQFKTGKFDGHVQKFLEGSKMLEDGSWETWYADQLANKKVKGNRPATEPAFMAQWIKVHNLQPRQSNTKLYGMHSTAVLKVLARTWLQNVSGPKVSNFIQNLVGTGHGATIDVWANRTMRRFGYEGFQERWRLLPGNEAAVSDPDFFFSQKAFAQAAERLGILPDALQGGLWFAEKKHWADRQWGKLDLGSYLTELKKAGTIREGIAKRLAAEITKRPEK